MVPLGEGRGPGAAWGNVGKFWVGWCGGPVRTRTPRAEAPHPYPPGGTYFSSPPSPATRPRELRLDNDMRVLYYAHVKNKKQRTLAVDEFIEGNLEEPNKFPRRGAQEYTSIDGEPEDGLVNNLLRMSDAALEGRMAYYEKESIFACADSARADAKLEMSRTQREIVRRKIVARNEANKSFAGQAPNDLEADHVVQPALAG